MSLPDYTKFKQYCAQRDVHLLPDDISYIDRALKKYSAEESRKLLLDYVQEWLSGINEEQKDAQKQNKGRCRANQWLADWVYQNRAKNATTALNTPLKSAHPVQNTPPSRRIKNMSPRARAAREECLAVVGLLVPEAVKSAS